MMDSEWLKANINIKQNDIIKFIDEGSIENPDDAKKRRMNIGVEAQRGNAVLYEKKLTLNKTNLAEIHKLYGMDSAAWVGKYMVVNVGKVRNPQSNSMVDGIILSAPNHDKDGNVIIQ